MFCERCGIRRITSRRAAFGSSALRECPGCTSFVCDNCWNTSSGSCISCHEEAASVVAPTRTRRLHPVAIATATAIAAVVTLALAQPFSAPRESNPPGAVAGATPAAPAQSDRNVSIPPSSAPATAPSASSGAPSPGLRVEVSHAVAWSWAGPGATEAHVVAGLTNRGGALIELGPASTSYELHDQAGSLVITGRFAYPMPATIAPGETAWLVDSMAATFVEPGPGWAVTVDPQFREARQSVPRYAVDQVEWRLGPAGLEATGRVTNDTGEPAKRPIVTIIFLDERGSPLAGLYDLTDAVLLANGESRTFSTDYPGSPPVDPERVADVLAFASEAAPALGPPVVPSPRPPQTPTAEPTPTARPQSPTPAVTPSPTADGSRANHVDNGGFEAAAPPPWTLFVEPPATADLTIDRTAPAYEGSQSARIDLAAPAATGGGVSLRQEGIAIDPGRRYLCRVAVRGASSRDVSVRVASLAGATYGARLVPVGTAWTVVEFEFGALVADPAAVVEIGVGRSAVTTWVDGVEVIDVTDALGP
jgi:hypothetical protein